MIYLASDGCLSFRATANTLSPSLLIKNLSHKLLWICLSNWRVAFKHAVADFNGKEVEFEVENLNVRPEFTVLKPYFIRFLKSTTVWVNIWATFQHNRLVFKSASSNDLDKINREVIESVKFRFLNKKIIKSIPASEENLLDAGQVQSDSEQLIYTSEDDLLENILGLKQYKHHRHLRYLLKNMNELYWNFVLYWSLSRSCFYFPAIINTI